jgi:hypothetical protein
MEVWESGVSINTLLEVPVEKEEKNAVRADVFFLEYIFRRLVL